MKALFYCMAVILLATSCQSSRIPYTQIHAKPFVQTKDGTTINANSVRRNAGLFQKDLIIADNKSFKPKEVAFYSDGIHNFANINKRGFGIQVAEGNINLFMYISGYSNIRTENENLTYITHGKTIYYYIQKNEREKVKKLNYNNLREMIAPNTVEYKKLESYRIGRIVTRTIGYAALGAIASGYLMVKYGTGDMRNLGNTFMAGGLLSSFLWMTIYIPNKNKLLKTVLLADKVKY